MTPATTPISFPQAIFRGLRNRCPNCGQGRLFAKYLKTHDACPACGEELHHHRADDLPAYLTILLLGHILVPGIITVEMHYHPAYWIQALIWIPVTLILSLALLHWTKGMVVAAEWFLGLRGFHASKQRRMGANTGE